MDWDYRKIIDDFKNSRVLVLGDLIMDRFIWGKVSRISPEAPVPVVEVTHESMMLGGAANVANNIAALGGNVTLAGVTGNDSQGMTFRKLLQLNNIEYTLFQDERPTTLKTRIIANNQQVVRFDREEKGHIPEKIMEEMFRFIREAVAEHDAVIISDYLKGLVTRELVEEVLDAAKGEKLVAVDPKSAHINCYKGVSLIKPNITEAAQCAGVEIKDEDSLLKAGKSLMETLSCRAVLITRGEEGMSLFEEGLVTDIPTLARHVYDVTGAGDTVISAFTLAYASGASMYESASIANHAAGLVVAEMGTAVPAVDRLVKSLGTNGNRTRVRAY
jgi:rfaE bifunctional protein kinase chain/domain